MLKIYTDTTFLTEDYRKVVFPLLFDLHFIKNEKLLNYYKIIDAIEVSDVVIMPIDYSLFFNQKKAFNTLIKQSKTHQKSIWIYSAGDYGFTNYIKHSFTFRLGGFHSKLANSTFILPSFINDPYNSFDTNFSLLKKEETPSIGFVGHAQTGFLKLVKEFIVHFKFKFNTILKKHMVDSQSFYASSVKRAGYLNILANNSSLKTQFILRNKYRAGVNTDSNKKLSTKEFYENMFNNAYTFCSRGVGNFSVRFYETLAMGRIPVLLNTDCRLPLDSIINWKKHVVIIEENQINKMSEIIHQFHDAMSDIEFETLQKSNRILWKNTLKRDTYFIEIHNIFQNELKVS